jgi:hypothetical protein
MPSLLKRKIFVALICALPAVLGVESTAGHSGAGSSSGMGSGSGAGSSSGHGGAIPGSAPSSGHSSTGSGHSSTGLNSGHSSTGLNSAHMSGASRGGHFASDRVTDPAATGGAGSGRFMHAGASRTIPVQNANQRQFATGYVPSNLQANDELWRKRHRYHRFSSP